MSIQVIRAGRVLGLLFLSVGCSMNTARNHYLLAEKLWQGHSYAAAVSEFEKAATKDPRGKLGLQALFRAASTQSLFLSQYPEAIKKLNLFIQLSGDPASVWDAQLQVGEILFAKTEQYDQAIVYYQALIQANPTASEIPELMFRVGKSYFYLFKFQEAVDTFKKIIDLFRSSSWAEKAAFQIGLAYFTRGEKQVEEAPLSQSLGRQSSKLFGKKEQRRLPFQEAMEAYAHFIKEYPKSSLVAEAQFGIAGCLEETNRIEEAYQAYSKIQNSYPSPKVVEIKLKRLSARLQASKLRGELH